MKTAFRVIFVTVFIAGFGIAATSADKPFIQTKNKKIVADKVTSDSRGVLSYTASGFSQKIKPGAYLYARIPKPKAVSKAFSRLKSRKYADAAKAFEKAYKDYRYVGWDVYCIYYGAYALEKAGKKAEAIARLNLLKKQPKDKTKINKYMEAKKLLAELYITDSKFPEAQKVLKELGAAPGEDIPAFANVKQGDILLKQGKRKDALLMYLRTVLLFDKSNKKERPEALKKTVEILKGDRNNKYLVFEKILKTDYPGAK
jgi:predicted negative regulator of RcsB-dependent stress response